MNHSKSTVRFVFASVAVLALGVPSAGAFSNNGLVGVGRLDGNLLDATGLDTLGGIFSSLWVDSSSVRGTPDASGNFTYTGKLLGLPDRGFGDGLQDYRPRIQEFEFTFAPVAPNYAGPVLAQNQLQLKNTSSLVLTYQTGSGLAPFTGFNPNDRSVTSYPQSAVGSLGGGRRSMDPEGLVRLKNGDLLISDEYGPNVYRFTPTGMLISTLALPEALVPRVGGTIVFDQDQNGSLTSGRRSNRGMEGLSVSPDQSRLFAMLQSPTDQDGGQDNGSRNTRILVYDLTQPNTPLIAEYIYQLTLQGNPSNSRNTPVSEILALNNNELLILERDGRGGLTQNNVPTYKSVVRADLSTGQNILGSSYDQAAGTAGQQNLPNGLSIPVTPVSRQDLVNLLDTAQLAKFGLNIHAAADENSITEKWEGLGLIPNLSTPATDDFYLLVGNDNDFVATEIVHNGVVVGTSSFKQDNFILAYDVTLPGARTSVPEALPGWCAAVVLSGCWMVRRRSSS